MNNMVDIIEEAKESGITIQPYTHPETNTPLVMLTDDDGYKLYIGYRNNPTWSQMPLTVALAFPDLEPLEDVEIDNLLAASAVSLLPIFALKHDMMYLCSVFIDKK